LIQSADPSQADTLAWLGLTLVPGVSWRMQHALLAAFGSPHAVAAAAMGDLRAVVDERAAAALAKGADQALVEASMAWLSCAGHHLVTLADEDYPRALLEAGQAPCALYAQGRRELLNVPAFAIVGSRNATPQALRDAQAFARALSDAGLCVVSGLALGIDAAAHRGGLEGRSSSIAVMGTGPDRVYPAANRKLAREIAQTGCVLTEFPVGTAATAPNFPRRNRLISGLSRGVLVVEAAMQSGSLITARCAADQGRDVFAVPGSIHSALSKGCHALIRDGAKLVESAEDILVELGMGRPEEKAKASAPHHPLLQLMGFAPISFDQMVERTGLSASELSSRLSHLEIEGRIEALAGGWFQRIVEAQ
jgi:DNA processing protein